MTSNEPLERADVYQGFKMDGLSEDVCCPAGQCVCPYSIVHESVSRRMEKLGSICASRRGWRCDLRLTVIPRCATVRPAQ